MGEATTPVLPATQSTTPIAFVTTDSSVELAQQHIHPASIEVLSHTTLEEELAQQYVYPASVEVLSHSTLQWGDTFKASVDGIQFFARVPQGGVQQGETFINVYPRFVKVKAPKCYNAGVTFEATHEGVPFLATVPVGGCQQGDMIETLHPSVAPPYGSRHRQCCQCCGLKEWTITLMIILPVVVLILCIGLNFDNIVGAFRFGNSRR